ncbi:MULTISPECIES: DUF6264 family protein [unclassified Mycobacterium]|uniref:DUF6264 family protein n=1 Tax=unclassified Mycobacterium TaxID=2642494 RepID=UPI0007FE5650|nr:MULTISPECIES: DUF6264 family protein [unclassified Mycobacterium]OBG56275.1 hypothetical protein A5704_24350 [Mycobacterium sp. E735]OBG64379.1 hypothetical protein A5703_17985 [Mycobacterium sp. E188]OBH36134.1 hypothetical protein A5691_05260 [Mycobacterium sp. E183]
MSDDNEMQSAVAAYSRRSERSLAVDRTATVALLAAQAFLVAVTIGLLSVYVMATDSCGYQKCGDPAWINRAMVLGIGGGGVIFAAALFVAVRRLARRRTAFFVPIIGCLAQVALAAGAVAMEFQAGPV